MLIKGNDLKILFICVYLNLLKHKIGNPLNKLFQENVHYFPNKKSIVHKLTGDHDIVKLAFSGITMNHGQTLRFSTIHQFYN